MKKRIVFGITSLDYGGVELSLVDLVNKLCGRYDITILTLYSDGNLINKINKKVKIESIYKHKFTLSNDDQRRKIRLKLMLSSRTLYYRYLKNKYDVEIAFMEGPMTILMSTPNMNVKKIAWIHTDISSNKVKGVKKHLKKAKNNSLYQMYDEVVFSGELVKEKFEQYYYVDVNKRVIPNYIDVSRVKRLSIGLSPKEYKKNEKKLVVVTNLEKLKAIDRLLIVHKRLITDGYIHKMYVIGDGPQRSTLEKLVNKLNATETFKLIGKRDNPYLYIKYADVMITTPSYDSYGVSVLESMILNKTILSTETSVSKMYSNYPNIIEVKNNDENIYEGLKYVLTTKKLREKNYFKFNGELIIRSIIDLIEK